MKRITVFLLALFLVTAVIGCASSSAEKTQYGKALDFELEDINGNTVKLSEYKGKVIILNFFATWCPPCRKEMPGFNEIANEYKNNVKIIAINVGREALSRVKGFADSYNLEFPIIMDDGRVSNLYGPITAVPVTVIVDRNFNIAKRYVGMRPKEVFVEDIKELL